MDALWRLRAVWLSKNEAVSCDEAWGTTRHGNPVAWLLGVVVDLPHWNSRPERRRSNNAGLEDERPSLESQGEKYGSHQ